MGVLTVDGTLLTGSLLQDATTAILPLLGRQHTDSNEAFAAVDLDTAMHVFTAGFGGEHSACLALPRDIF